MRNATWLGATLCLLAAVGCGDYAEPDAGERADTCVPRACPGTECGTLEDGCGGTLQCECEAECTSDADCPGGTVCDVAGARCTTECRTGRQVGLDLPVQPVTLHVTLDGQPLPNLPAEESQVTLAFIPISPAPWISTAQLYDRDAGPEPLTPTVSLAPAVYQVVFGKTEILSDPWPADLAATLGEVEVRPGDTELSIDIRTHAVSLDVTLNGAELPPELVAEDHLLTLNRGGAYAFRSRLLPSQLDDVRRLIEGPIEVEFERARGPSAVAPTSGHVGDVLVDSDGVIGIDIPRVQLTVRLTREDGAPPDDVTLSLVPVGAPDYERGDALGTTTAGELVSFVQPGRYRLRSTAGPDDWPQGDWDLAELDIVGDRVVDLALTPTRVRVDARLASPATDDCREAGRVRIAGTNVDLTADGAASSADVWAFVGPVEPEYLPPACAIDGTWPSVRVGLPSVAVTPGVPIDIVVRRAVVQLPIEVDGSPPQPVTRPANQLVSPPALRVYGLPREHDGASVGFYEYGFDDGVYRPVPAAITVVAGARYQIAYRGGNSMGQWPPAGRILVEDWVPDEGEQTVPLTLSTVPVVLDLTLAGEALPMDARETWGGGGWPPGILLDGDETLSWFLPPWSTERDEPVRSQFEMRAFPGRYDLVFGLPLGFSLHLEGPLPPGGLPLGCWQID